MPIKPRSPVESTGTVKNGVGNSTPFLITRNFPPCCETKRRPSGANSIWYGRFKPDTHSGSVNPVGSTVAADTVDDGNNGMQSETSNAKSPPTRACPPSRDRSILIPVSGQRRGPHSAVCDCMDFVKVLCHAQG